jgi:hypothetical protein
MSNFPVAIDATTLYFGNFINLRALPWHYLPVWIIITTPPLIVVLFFFGIINILLNFKNKFIVNYDQKYLALIINCTVVITPILVVILLNSPVYNGWRHLYFIYPSFLIISLYGFALLLKSIKLFLYAKIILIIIFLIFISHQIYWIITAHPIQNVYFNFIVGKEWKRKFDVDYWGLGNHIVLKRILSEDKRALISVCPISTMSLTLRSLNKFDKERVRITCFGKPDYLINNYYEFRHTDKTFHYNYNIIHELKISNEIIISTYKLN